MKIGVNGRFLVAQQTGVQRAAFNLTKTLIKIDSQNEYVIFTSPDQKGREEWNFPNVKIVSSDLKSGASLRNHWWEQFTLPRLAKQENVDILYSPANTAPFFYQGKSVLFIHDLCFVVNPQWYSYSFRTLYNLLIPKLAKKATRVITNSNNSRNDLLKFCGIPSDKVRIVYLAADAVFSEPSPKQLAPLIEQRNAEKIILYVGSLEPRKNIKSLLEAFYALRQERSDIKVKLVLIGCESPLFAKTGLKIDKEFEDDIIFKGFVDDSILKSYYEQATVVAYPSIYEGFGLPPLEAMTCGTPVITSYSSSLPEVVGKAAIMVDPFDKSQLKQGLIQVLTDENLQTQMINSGYKQVTKFSWLKVAKDTLSVFYELTDDKRNDSGCESNYMSFQRWKSLEQLENL